MRDELTDLLEGDGSEFETAAAIEAAAENVPSAAPTIRNAMVNGPCPDGEGICRGDAPPEGSLDRSGPYRYASYKSGFRDGPEFGGGTIYYPQDAEPPLSGVIMCPGFTARQSSIAAWGPFFASHGILLMTIDTNTTGDFPQQRARALLDALVSLKAETTRVGSPLNGKLSSDRYGLAGWSMGGGGTWLAAAKHPELKTAVTLAGHNLAAGGPAIARGTTVPTLMMNGAADITILGGLGQSEGAYRNIPASTPKLLYVMTGYGHFAWGTPRTNGNASGRYMMAWQKTFLEGDERYKKFLLEKGAQAGAWQSNIR